MVSVSVKLTTNLGHVEGFDTENENCEGTGILAGCELEEDEVTNLPLALTPGVGAVTFTEAVFHRVWENCPVNKLTHTFEELTLTPDNPDAISSFDISGEAIIDTVGQEIKGIYFGELIVVGSDSETFGIGES